MEIRLIGESEINYNGEILPVTVQPTELVTSSISGDTYEYRAIQFQGELAKQADACLFTLKPQTITNVVAITEEGLVCTDTIHRGTGIALLYTPEHDLQILDLDTRTGRYTQFSYQRGAIVAYATLNLSMELLGFASPPFKPSYEIEAKQFGQEEIGGFQVSPRFWETLANLRQF